MGAREAVPASAAQQPAAGEVCAAAVPDLLTTHPAAATRRCHVMRAPTLASYPSKRAISPRAVLERTVRMLGRGFKRYRAQSQRRLGSLPVVAALLLSMLALLLYASGQRGPLTSSTSMLIVSNVGDRAARANGKRRDAGSNLSEQSVWSTQTGSVTDRETTAAPNARTQMDLPLNTSSKDELDTSVHDDNIDFSSMTSDELAMQPVSMVVLFHNEYDTLLPVLQSWIDNGLIDYVDEVLVFLNGAKSDDVFRKRVPVVASGLASGKVRLIAQPEDLRIGLALKRMVELAKYEFVLLMEKDWELIEAVDVMRSRLRDSKVLVGSGIANVVRHRHRVNPGVPIHALIMHAGREELLMKQQPNLMCFVHHWQKDPTSMYPGATRMWRCGGKERNVVEEDVFCSPARFCQWTNNPGLFRKSWFLAELANDFEKFYNEELAKEGPRSPYLDFEYYTNWVRTAWNSRNFTVAVGAGLFHHLETEHQHFNTFWYAHFRLLADFEDIRTSYLQNETRFKRLGGVHVEPNAPPPPSLVERYPVPFVRKHQVNFLFSGNLDTQREMIAEVFDPYMKEYRAKVEPATGKESLGLLGRSKATKQVPWRSYITNLHFATEKAMLASPAVLPHEMSITLVTSLLNIGRHEVDRDFQMYMDAMLKWLTHEYKKIVYTTPEIADLLRQTAPPSTLESTSFVYTNNAELRSRWIGADNYDKIQEIREDPDWSRRANWLSESPQAKLKEYNPLVMAKLYMLHHASRQNVWNTTHFVYVDAKHNCQNPIKMTPRSDHILRAHMLDKFMITYFEYLPVSEVHGFEYSAFNHWLNLEAGKDRVPVKVGRGGIFGGSAFILEAIAAMYDVALTATLREGLMGTEENIFSILMYQVPQHMDPFSNNWACRKQLHGDHKCAMRNRNYNCGIFVWAAEGAPGQA